MSGKRTIAFLVYPGALALDVCGPAEVFEFANVFMGAEPPYRLIYLSQEGGGVRTSSGICIDTGPLRDVEAATLDTLIIPGGPRVYDLAADAGLGDWIRSASGSTRRMCGVCTGAKLLAAAGLLDGKRAVTHWSATERLQNEHPNVKFELDPIYVKDGDTWTSAGVTAGMDLALALVQDDLGREISLAVAKEMVVFMQRPGGQAQFSSVLATQAKMRTKRPDDRLSGIVFWILDHMQEELTTERLASWAGMTPRTFARYIANNLDTTPAKLVEDTRLDAAARFLEENVVSIKQVAAMCGFGDDERMRRAFQRRYKVSPGSYRARFAARAPSAQLPSETH